MTQRFRSPRLSMHVLLTACLAASPAAAGTLRHTALDAAFRSLTQGFNGRVGVCAMDSQGATCVNRDQRFPMQSVMKLLVGVAAMDAADRGQWTLKDPIVVRTEDLSLAVQPLATLVGPQGFRTTIDDLVRRAVVDSDSAATDILIARLGGTQAVQRAIERLKVTGMRLDRDERHLQTEIIGITWRPEFVDAAVLGRAVAAVPDARRDAAYRAYQSDERDTSTPEGMARLLQSLAEGRLLSAASTRRLIEIMTGTVTFPDRLKAGLASGWSLAHKTGTSSTWKGVTAASNDVGILMAPDGGRVSIAVFVADSTATDRERAQLMERLARATIEHYQ